MDNSSYNDVICDYDYTYDNDENGNTNESDVDDFIFWSQEYHPSEK